MGALQIRPITFTGSETDQRSDCDIEKLLNELEHISSKLSVTLLPRKQGCIDEVAIDSLVTNILRSRRRRSRLFGDGLFGEPAWDILLELYAAERSQRKLSVSGACYASAAPPSTGLRWIGRLEKDGWVRRIDDSADLRRSWLVLTEAASVRMRQILGEFATYPI